jgi:hypothetical protein
VEKDEVVPVVLAYFYYLELALSQGIYLYAHCYAE